MNNTQYLPVTSDGRYMGIPSVNSPASDRNFTDNSSNFTNFKFDDQTQSFSFIKRLMDKNIESVPQANANNAQPVTSPQMSSHTQHVQVTPIAPPSNTTQNSSSDLSTSASLSDLSSATTTAPATNGTQELVPVPNGQHFVDITEYLNMPQKQAAKKLGIPTSTLSKRWKEACRNRKWPYRNVSKLDREITTLLHNLPQGQSAWPADVEETLGFLLRKRQEELRPVVIRI